MRVTLCLLNYMLDGLVQHKRVNLDENVLLLDNSLEETPVGSETLFLVQQLLRLKNFLLVLKLFRVGKE
jgi:hypothetical protein